MRQEILVSLHKTLRIYPIWTTDLNINIASFDRFDLVLQKAEMLTVWLVSPLENRLLCMITRVCCQIEN